MILAAWYHPILATLFTLVAVFLMMVILLQRGRGVGLSGAFGGAATNTAFGSKTGDVLTWATVVIACFFLLLTVVLNYVFVPQGADLSTGSPSVTTPAPASTPPPAGTTAELPISTGQQQGATPTPGPQPAGSDTQPPADAGQTKPPPAQEPPAQPDETGGDNP